MADEVVVELEQKEPEGPVSYPENEYYDFGPAKPGGSIADIDAKMDVVTEKDEEPAFVEKTEATPPVVPAVEPVKPAHTSESIDKALRLGIPVADIDDMTPKELGRLITHMNTFGQQVYDQTVAKAAEKPAAAPAPAEPEDQYDWDRNENGHFPEQVALAKQLSAMKASLKEVADLKKELAEVKQQASRSSHEEERTRIVGLLTQAGVADKFNTSTAEGKVAYKELMAAMVSVLDLEQKTGKFLQEPARLQRALRLIEVEVPQAKDEDAEKKEAWANGSLAKATSRGKPKTFDEETDDIARRHGINPGPKKAAGSFTYL